MYNRLLCFRHDKFSGHAYRMLDTALSIVNRLSPLSDCQKGERLVRQTSYAPQVCDRSSVNAKKHLREVQMFVWIVMVVCT